MEIYSTWHVHISVHMTYSFDHKRYDVTTLSWYNHAIINTSCGRMLVIADYKGRIDLCLSEDIRFYASPWWRHQMETISALLALCAGINRSPVNSPHKGQWHVALKFSFICAWTNGCANNRDAGDLTRHRAHYDVTVMLYSYTTMISVVGCQNIGKWFIAMVDYNFGNSITDIRNDIYNVRNVLYLPNSRINSIVE